MKIAIIADIHEDIVSLTEAIRRIEKQNIDEIICLGDISGYSIPYHNYLNTRNAHECLSLIRSVCKYVVLGNHDMHAANIIPNDCSFFTFPKNWYQLDYHQRYKMANNTLWLHEEHDLNPLYKNDDILYLKSLPEFLVINVSGYNLLLTHYIYPNISGLKKGFYTYGDEFQQHFDFMESVDCRISFTGHSHIKGFFMAGRRKYKQYRYTRKTIPNDTTCIGVPPITNKGRRSGLCIFDPEELTIEIQRI